MERENLQLKIQGQEKPVDLVLVLFWYGNYRVQAAHVLYCTIYYIVDPLFYGLQNFLCLHVFFIEL